MTPAEQDQTPKTPEGVVDSAPDSADVADGALIQQLQAKLNELEAKANEIEQKATQLVAESNGEESSEAKSARQQALEMRGAADQARRIIADVKGKKHVSGATLRGITTLINDVLVDAEVESSELSAVLTEVHFRNSKQSLGKTNTSKITMASRLSAAFTGKPVMRSAASYDCSGNDDEIEFEPSMNKRDRRNHDGILSGREMALGSWGLARAIASEKKRKTFWEIQDQLSDAIEKGDVRGMNDAALREGRGVARATGSNDFGHAVAFVESTVTTKKSTLGNLIVNGDGWGLLGALGRNVSAIGEAAADQLGINTLADEVRPHLARLLTDKNIDWEHLVDEKNIKQFDTGGNGIIEAPEILQVLRNNGITFEMLDDNGDKKIGYEELTQELLAIAKKNHAHVEGGIGLAPLQKRNPNQGKMVPLDGFGEKTIEQARDILLSKHIVIDTNKGQAGNVGITYQEAFAAVNQWNATHAPDGKLLVPSASPAQRPAAAARAHAVQN